MALVDDMITLHGGRKGLLRKLKQLEAELAQWGLKLNANNCQVYRNPYSQEIGELSLTRHTRATSTRSKGIEAGDLLHIDNLPWPWEC